MKYLINGDTTNPCILFIHGFALHPSIWDMITQELSTNYQCISIELPRNIDATDKGADIETKICDNIKQLLTTLNINQTSIVGHSMGGYFSLAFAEKYPASITHLLLLNSTCFADDAIRRDKRKQIIQHLKKYGSSSFCSQAIPSWIAPEYKQQNPAIVVEITQEASQLDSSTLIAYQQYMIERPERKAVMESPDITSLVIVGELDPMIGSVDFQELKNTQINTIENAAHMCMLEKPTITAQIIHQFIQQNS